MTLTPRRFLLCRGSQNMQIEVASVDDLTNAVGTYVHLYDTAEMLAGEAWAGRIAEHGLITLEPR